MSGLVWVVDGYTLSFAALLLAGGALATRYGARRAYIAGLALFVVASLLCGAASSDIALVGARLLQGAAAALFIPSSLGLLTLAYPEEKQRSRMLGLWSAIVSLSAASGPIVGGLVVSTLGWRAVFWLNVPIGIAGVLLARRYLLDPAGCAQPLMLRGHATGALTLGALAYALIQGPVEGWAAPSVLAAALACMGGAMMFVWLERHAGTPILPRVLVADVRFRRINFIGLGINFGVFGTLFLVTLYHQQVQHSSAFGTGLALLPLMAVFTIGNLLATKLMSRLGTGLPMRCGLVLALVGSVALASAGLQGRLSPSLVDTLLALANLGSGIAIPAMTSSMMTIGQGQYVNTAAAALNANRQTGALLGVALVGVVLHSVTDWSYALPFASALLACAYGAAAALAWRSEASAATR